MNNPAQHVPAINTPHECIMCGQKTNWEERQRQAEKMRIFGMTIKEIEKMKNWSFVNGYRIGQ